jgi:hypothetical protein
VTGAAEIVARLEALGGLLALGPDGRIDADVPAVPEAERLLDALAAVSADAKRLLRERPARPCLDCGLAADERTLFCPACWDRRREPGRLLALDEDRLRRHEEWAARTAGSLVERYCEACGFSFWRVSPRGDASCYACVLLREGKPFRCAGCGDEKWRRDSAGRRVCSTCHGGDSRGAAPGEIAASGATSREFPAPGGAV